MVVKVASANVLIKVERCTWSNCCLRSDKSNDASGAAAVYLLIKSNDAAAAVNVLIKSGEAAVASLVSGDGFRPAVACELDRGQQLQHFAVQEVVQAAQVHLLPLA
jgi:hypothetical protein